MSTKTYEVPEFALSGEEGAAALAECQPFVDDEWRVVLDMKGCHVLCSHWLSGFYGPLFDEYDVAEVRGRVLVKDASATNQQAVDLMFESAAKWEEDAAR